MTSPFLTPVLAGYAVFVAVLGIVSLQQAFWKRRLVRAMQLVSEV